MAHNNEVWSIEISKCERFLFSGGFDGHLKQWSIQNQNLVRDFEVAHRLIDSLAVTPDCEFVFTGGATGDQT